MITSLGCLETGNTEEHGERQKLDYSPASIWTARGLRRETFHRPLMINNAKFIEIRYIDFISHPAFQLSLRMMQPCHQQYVFFFRLNRVVRHNLYLFVNFRDGSM